MNKIIMSVLGVLWAVNGYAQVEAVEGFGGPCIRAIAPGADNKEFYFLTRNSLIKQCGTLKETVTGFIDAEGKAIAISGEAVYVATDRAVYKVGAVKEKIFEISDGEVINALEFFIGRLFIVTTKSLYHCDPINMRRHKVIGLPEDNIIFLKVCDSRLYAGSARGAYFIDSRLRAQKIIAAHLVDDACGRGVSFIMQDELDLNKLWLVMDGELMVSTDRGVSWAAFLIEGTQGLKINALIQNVHLKHLLYFATDTGLFKIDLKNPKPQAVLEGLPGARVNSLQYIQQELYLATEHGLFILKSDNCPDLTGSREDKYIPQIQEVQAAALHYNMVDPEKIRQWRQRLKLRALMPEFNIDYAKTMNYDSKSYSYIRGPRDWSAGLKWDLSERIWNSYEDDVDTRARLDSQMRIDIIDEVNRVYFERLRAQEELQDDMLSRNERAGRMMRMMELTATLDGYTGGWFSRRVSELEAAAAKFTGK